MRAHIELDLASLEENYKIIKNATNKEIIAVVKSNAYGHGLLECAKTLAKLHPKMLAVSTIEEALTIRKNLIFTPILLLEKSIDFMVCINYKITLSVISLSHLQNMQKSNLPLMIHLLIDTGMNRDGLSPDEIDEAIKIIGNSRLILKGIFTHFISKDNYQCQSDLFSDVLSHLEKKNLMIHSQASSTMLIKNETTNTIRIGLALYGLEETSLALKPILILKAPVIRIKKVKIGETVGYNEVGKITKDGYVYTCSIGYADGLLRGRNYVGHALGYFLPQIGNLCMDHIMFFSSDELKVNEIELIGEHIRVIDLAKLYKTIPYEITTQLSTRLKRRIIT